MASSNPQANIPGLLARLPFFYGWIVIAVAFVTMGIGVNARTAFSLLFPPLLVDFGWDRGVTAAAFSIGFLASTLYAPWSGTLMDRFGPRYVVSCGALLVSVGMATATRIQQPWHLYLTLGVLVVGGSFLLSYFGHALFIPNWFVRRRGLATGIAFSGVGVGSMLLLPWLQHIIDQVGWRHACWSMAIVLCVIVIPLNVLLQRQRPQDLGLEPDGDTTPSATGHAEETPSNVVDPDWVATEWTRRMAMRTARFWWVFVGFFSGLFAWYAVQVHQTKYLMETGFAAERAASALGWVGLTGIVGQIALGHLSDRVGREWAWTASGLGYVVCYVSLLLLPQYPTAIMLYLIVGSQGVLGYGLTSVIGAIPAELFHGKHYSSIFGTLSISAGLGAAGAPWITGMMYDRFGSYAPAWWLALGMSVVSILCIWCAAPRARRCGADRPPPSPTTGTLTAHSREPPCAIQPQGGSDDEHHDRCTCPRCPPSAPFARHDVRPCANASHLRGGPVAACRLPTGRPATARRPGTDHRYRRRGPGPRPAGTVCQRRLAAKPHHRDTLHAPPYGRYPEVTGCRGTREQRLALIEMMRKWRGKFYALVGSMATSHCAGRDETSRVSRRGSGAAPQQHDSRSQGRITDVSDFAEPHDPDNHGQEGVHLLDGFDRGDERQRIGNAVAETCLTVPA